MSFLDRILRKASEAFEAVLYPYGPGQPIYTPRNYESLAREGYASNEIVYRAVNAIADPFSNIPIKAYRNRGSDVEEVDDHPVLDLIWRPNPHQSEYEFRKAWAGYILLSGNAYIHGPAPDTGANSGRPIELWMLRPDRMKITAGTWQEPVSGYVYTDGGKEISFDAPAIGHAKLFNPLHEFYGMSPIEAAARGIDQYNSANAWNTALLQNMAAPPHWINMKGRVDASERESLKAQFSERMAGPENARKPVVTRSSDGIEVHSLGLSPVEMDWLEGKKLNAYAIATAFGVPAQVVGLPDSQTYANFEQAQRALYLDAVLPLLSLFCDTLTRWLVPKFERERGVYLWWDKSTIDPLQDDQSELMQRAVQGFTSGILTQRQAARMIGEVDDLAQDAYVWDLRGGALGSVQRILDEARKDFLAKRG